MRIPQSGFLLEIREMFLKRREVFDIHIAVIVIIERLPQQC
ncbi:MAG: hypothetical protein R3E58_00735 [Phycisphaerae bacterium]